MNLADIFTKNKKLFDSKVVSKETINEDLGSLNAIDKKFHKLFATGWNNKAKISGGAVGQQSPIETVEAAKPSDAAKLMFGEDTVKNNVQGMILIIHGVQVLAISKSSRNHKGTPEYKTMLDGDAYSKIEKDTDRKAKVSKVFNGYDTNLRSGVSDTSLSMSSAKYVLNAVYKAAKDTGAEGINALVIKTDPERAKKQQQRKTAQYGAMPASGEAIRSGKFKDDARRALSSRLEKFKAQKAEEFKTPQEFMAAAIQKGFMEKVNIDGFVYKMSEDQLRLRDIIKPSNWNRSNAIKYQLDSSHSDKLDALKKQVWDLHDAAKENPEVQTKIDELKAKYPPREISVIMGLEGGMIKPIDVKVSEDKGYW